MIEQPGLDRAVEDLPAGGGSVAAFDFVSHKRARHRLGGVEIVSVIEAKDLQVRPKHFHAVRTRSDVGPTEPAAASTAAK